MSRMSQPSSSSHWIEGYKVPICNTKSVSRKIDWMKNACWLNNNSKAIYNNFRTFLLHCLLPASIIYGVAWKIERWHLARWPNNPRAHCKLIDELAPVLYFSSFFLSTHIIDTIFFFQKNTQKCIAGHFPCAGDFFLLLMFSTVLYERIPWSLCMPFFFVLAIVNGNDNGVYLLPFIYNNTKYDVLHCIDAGGHGWTINTMQTLCPSAVREWEQERATHQKPLIFFFVKW